jgi:hypothetical protein
VSKQLALITRASLRKEALSLEEANKGMTMIIDVPLQPSPNEIRRGIYPIFSIM